MKFILIMTVCSSIYQTCINPIQMGEYNNWDSCARQGYAKSIELLDELGSEKVEQQRTYISFLCREVKEKIIVPKPKPKINA